MLAVVPSLSMSPPRWPHIVSRVAALLGAVLTLVFAVRLAVGGVSPYLGSKVKGGARVHASPSIVQPGDELHLDVNIPYHLGRVREITVAGEASFYQHEEGPWARRGVLTYGNVPDAHRQVSLHIAADEPPGISTLAFTLAWQPDVLAYTIGDPLPVRHHTHRLPVEVTAPRGALRARGTQLALRVGVLALFWWLAFALGRRIARRRRVRRQLAEVAVTFAFPATCVAFFVLTEPLARSFGGSFAFAVGCAVVVVVSLGFATGLGARYMRTSAPLAF